MDAFLPMLLNVFIFVLLALPGFILVKTKVLKSEHSFVLSKILVYVGSPFFIIFNMLQVDFSGQTTSGMLICCLIFSVCIILLFFLSILFAKVKAPSLELAKKKSCMIRFCSIFANNGFMGLPLAIAVFPNNPTLIAFLVSCNILSNVYMYTFGTYLASGNIKSVNLKNIFLNPVLISFVIAILLNVLNVKAYIPQVETYSNYFNNIVTPICMLVLGIKLGGANFKSLFTSFNVYRVSLFKLIISPIIAIAVAFALSTLLPDQTFNIVICAFISFATPTAALASALADQFGGDSDGSVNYTLGTTLLSIISIPILYLFLCMII